MAVYAGQWGSFDGKNDTAPVASSASATSVSFNGNKQMLVNSRHCSISV